MIINSERELWYNMLEENGLLNGKEFKISLDIIKELATISHLSVSPNKHYVLYDSINNGDLWGIFIKEEYRNLEVNGKVVVDIGANICDSSIYFVMRGAQRIIALEPFPGSYATAMCNVKSNKLCNIIQLSMAGSGGKPGHVYLSSKKGNTMSQTNSYQVDVDTSVPIMTLEQIIESFDIPNGSALKIDCEGCEYDSILNAPKDVLRRFDCIQIEYHFGFRNLKRRFEEIGFRVYVQQPTRWKQSETGKISYAGNILAKAIDDC